MTFLAISRGSSAVVQTSIANLASTGLAGCTFWFTAKYRATDADTLAVFQKLNASFTVTSVGSLTAPGVVLVTIQPADTASIPEYTKLLHWDIQMKDASANIYTVDSGMLRINADITQATS